MKDEKEKKPDNQCPKCSGMIKTIHPKQVLRCPTCGYLVEEKKE